MNLGGVINGVRAFMAVLLRQDAGLPSVDVTVVINAPWHRIVLARQSRRGVPFTMRRTFI